ncbi:MAG: 2-oxo acid dehydrogenase subunit E2 [Oscillatoriales cyanobacterium C42_A2020_001]|nr:2-oxo acid dehydrogenase subunit E2 [Leptolyngbyaceae cyanobacterium C42_A2020_001]
MKYELLVPRLNTNDDEVDIVHWYFKDREYVEKGQEIVDLESSKAVVSIESEASGYISCCFQKGDTVKVGVPLAVFYSSIAELEADLQGNSQAAQPTAANSSTQATPTELPAQLITSEHRSAPATPVLTAQQQVESQTASLEPQKPQPTFTFTRFSKAAQEYIERNQINPSLFEGMGLVSVEVIETVLGIRQPVVAPSNGSSQPYLSQGQVTISQPLTNPGLRSEKVSKSKQLEISLLTAGQSGGINSSLTVQFNSAGIRQTLEEMGSLNGQVLPLILFELARLLEEYPAFTAYYEAGQIYYYDRIDLGLAIDLGKGLKVPVIRNANQLSPAEILEVVTDFARRYLENQLTVDDLTGGTMTISDLSNEKILHFQPLINQNQAVILGIGGDSSMEGYPMTLTLVFDHRLLAGREVALFLNALRDRLLSYQLINLPVAEKAVQTKNVTCNRCLIDLDTLYQKFGKDALMHVHMNDKGQTAYICHVCLGGF